jgi:hypothetical protein
MGHDVVSAANDRKPAAMADRPPHAKPPAYLSPNTPVPKPAPGKKADDPTDRDPTRYGDWELKGIAIDF